MRKGILIAILIIVCIAELFSGAWFQELERTKQITFNNFGFLFLSVNLIAFIAIMGFLIYLLSKKSKPREEKSDQIE